MSGLLFFAVLVIIVIAAPAQAAIKFARKADSTAELMTEFPADSAVIAALPVEWLEFAATNGFSFSGMFRYEQCTLVAFHQANENSVRRWMMIILVLANRVPDLFTEFSDSESVTTSGGNALGMFPRVPGSFSQGFPHRPVPDLYQRHLEAESFLIQNRKVQCARITITLKERTERDIRAQARLVRETPLYWLKASYCFWIKRFLIANKPVAPRRARA
ncbi:MAG: hypothetical protein QOI07_1268 [Verrucomicrobiota bacterium]|jgi:hypothetical protein